MDNELLKEIEKLKAENATLRRKARILSYEEADSDVVMVKSLRVVDDSVGVFLKAIAEDKGILGIEIETDDLINIAILISQDEAFELEEAIGELCDFLRTHGYEAEL